MTPDEFIAKWQGVTLKRPSRASSCGSLDGNPVPGIEADLNPAAEGLRLAAALPLPANAGIAFQGPVKVGPFEVPGE